MEPEVPDFDFDAHIAELIARRYDRGAYILNFEC